MTDARSKGDQRGVQVDYEDVDDVIGIAAEMMAYETDQLSVDDLKAVAADLDIPGPYVERAVAELERRRAEQAAREMTRRKRRLRVALVAGAVVVLLFVISLAGQASLRGRLEQAEQERAQVRNVLERQQAVQARYQGLEPTPDREAELAGAENRVRIERRRFDEAATAYNVRATAFPGSLWVKLYGLPERIPLSNEVTEW